MSNAAPSPADRPFRWQALLGRAADPVFVLDRRCRLLYVNPALEALTGFPRLSVRGLVCRHPAAPTADAIPEETLAHLLTPPTEARQGQPTRVRRRALPYHRPDGSTEPSLSHWWDIDFLPVALPLAHTERTPHHLTIGRIIPSRTPAPTPDTTALAPLPEKLADLRQRHVSRYSFQLLESADPHTRRLARQVRLAAPLPDPVLLVGEPGTGKYTIARILHAQGPRRELPFTALDCRLPLSCLIEALRFASLTPGLLYLRWPNLLPREVQQSLADQLSADILRPRLIVGLTSDPESLLQTGTLLPGLYWRLSILTLHLPALRQRQIDIPLLVERLLQPNPGVATSHSLQLTPAVLDALRAHPWPGNLRELAEVIHESAQRNTSGKIDLGELPSRIRLSLQMDLEPVARQRPIDLDQILQTVETRLIELALRRANGNRTRAAELLGMARAKLVRRMDALNFVGDLPEG